MDWNLGWVFWGGAAFLLALVNLTRSLAGKRAGWQILMFASLSCGVITVLEEYRMVARWLQWGDLPAVQDVVPTMAGTRDETKIFAKPEKFFEKAETKWPVPSSYKTRQ